MRICTRRNGRYAACVRPLRAFAEVIQVKHVPDQMIIRRVEEICHREGHTINAQFVQSVVKNAVCDLRSALHTAQMLLKTREEDRSAQQDAAFGLKDRDAGPFEVWNMVFKNNKLWPVHQRHSAGHEHRFAIDLVRDVTETTNDSGKILHGPFGLLC